VVDCSSNPEGKVELVSRAKQELIRGHWIEGGLYFEKSLFNSPDRPLVFFMATLAPAHRVAASPAARGITGTAAEVMHVTDTFRPQLEEAATKIEKWVGVAKRELKKRSRLARRLEGIADQTRYLTNLTKLMKERAECREWWKGTKDTQHIDLAKSGLEALERGLTKALEELSLGKFKSDGLRNYCLSWIQQANAATPEALFGWTRKLLQNYSGPEQLQDLAGPLNRITVGLADLIRMVSTDDRVTAPLQEALAHALKQGTSATPPAEASGLAHLLAVLSKLGEEKYRAPYGFGELAREAFRLVALNHFPIEMPLSRDVIEAGFRLCLGLSGETTPGSPGGTDWLKWTKFILSGVGAEVDRRIIGVWDAAGRPSGRFETRAFGRAKDTLGGLGFLLSAVDAGRSRSFTDITGTTASFFKDVVPLLEKLRANPPSTSSWAGRAFKKIPAVGQCLAVFTDGVQLFQAIDEGDGLAAVSKFSSILAGGMTLVGCLSPPVGFVLGVASLAADVLAAVLKPVKRSLAPVMKQNVPRLADALDMPFANAVRDCYVDERAGRGRKRAVRAIFSALDRSLSQIDYTVFDHPNGGDDGTRFNREVRTQIMECGYSQPVADFLMFNGYLPPGG